MNPVLDQTRHNSFQQTLKSEATSPMSGIGFVLPGMLRPRPGGKPE